MLKEQLAKGNNGLVKHKYLTFTLEADSLKNAKSRLSRLETDILNPVSYTHLDVYKRQSPYALKYRQLNFHSSDMVHQVTACL